MSTSATLSSIYTLHTTVVCISEIHNARDVVVCTITHIAGVWINQVRLPILLVVSGTGKIYISLSPFAPENLVSRDGFGSPVSRQPINLHTQAESGAYLLRDSSRILRRRPFIYLNRHEPSGKPRVYRVPHLRTDGVYSRESADTGPVNPKVVPNGCCLGRSSWTKRYAPLFSTLLCGRAICACVSTPATPS